jgi:hypothetical protein
MTGLADSNSRKRPFTVCHRCERVYAPGHPWMTVTKHGARPEMWEFCSIECLAVHFEIPDYSWVPK